MIVTLNNTLELNGVVNVVEYAKRNTEFEELRDMKCVSIFFSKECAKSLDELYYIFMDPNNYKTIAVNGVEIGNYNELVMAGMIIPEDYDGAIKKVTLKRVD